jgi:hypothetical protein
LAKKQTSEYSNNECQYIKFQLKRRNDQKRSALKILKNLDFNDSKATAYTFSRYASVLVNDDNIEFYPH